MGFFNKIAQGLKKTRDSMMGKVDALLNSFTKIDEDFFEELEENLIMADVGAVTAARICDRLRKKVKEEGLASPDQVRSGLKQIISQMLEGPSELDLSTKPSVILVIGVNGVGKTTTIGKLANNLRHLRKQHELTQKDLSRMLNISRQAYSNYETSKRTPDLDSLLYLSRFYHISLDTLVLRNLADTSPLPVFTERRPASYLLGKDKKTGAAIYLSQEELDFIIRFRSLTQENRQLVTGFIANSSIETNH